MNRLTLTAMNSPFFWSEIKNNINFVIFQREIPSYTLNEMLPPWKDLTHT